LHIHLGVRHRLRAIDDDSGACRARHRADFLGGIDQPKHIGHVTECHQLRPAGEQLFQLIESQMSLIVDIDHPKVRTGLSRGSSPRHQVGVVFRHCQDDVVARVQ